MSERRRRSLSAEDQALWDLVTATVTRPRRRVSKPVERRTAPTHTTPDAAKTKPSRSALTLKPAGPKEPAIRTPVPVKEPASGLDGRRAERLRRGELPIEARIDLHGLTLQLAHAALGGFLVQARARGARLALVITGKGGALRELVPRWLAEPQLAAMIADRATAKPRHGGEGALYVYLRRRRS